MQRRCNYSVDAVNNFRSLMGNYAAPVAGTTSSCEMFNYYLEMYNLTGMPDVVILPFITEATVNALPANLAAQLTAITGDMLKHSPFELVTVHDAFGSLPQYSNWVRWHYKEILADLADSHFLDYLLSTLYGQPGSFTKLSANLGDKIRLSNYALS